MGALFHLKNKRKTKNFFAFFRVTILRMSKSVFVKKSLISEVLGVRPIKGKRLLEPLKTFSAEKKLPFNILEDTEVTNEVEVHMNEGDLWYCLEGEVTFVCGGEMQEPSFRKNADGTENKSEIKASGIKNGETLFLKSGDWLWIPSGEPHQHSSSGTARLVIIKIPKASL